MLTDIAVKRVQAREKDFKLADAEGLYLFVTTRSAKIWRVDYRFGDKRRTATLGRYPDVSLADARRQRDDLKAIVAKGLDPVREKELEEQRKATEADNTFGTVADDFLARQRDRHPPLAEITIERAERILTKSVGNKLRAMPIRSITSADILHVLNMMADTGRRETARRMRSTISAVFAHAIATLRTDTDPTYVLRRALSAPKVTHMAAITDEAEFGQLLLSIEESNGWWSVKSYLAFLALTFVRPGEARLAHWTEIDLKEKVWNIPASRMKMRRPHEVPLSRQALEVLTFAHAAAPDSPLLFPSLRSNTKALSDNAANSVLRKIGYSRDQMVAHGFRSTASTILNRRKFDREVIEMQLAHTPDDRIRAIYNRDRMWSERVRLMQRWADIIDFMKMT